MNKKFVYSALLLCSALTSPVFCSQVEPDSPPMSPRTSYVNGRFPNLFQTLPADTRQEMVEEGLDRILNHLLVPHYDHDAQRILFDGFFHKIVTTVKKEDPNARVYIAGGMIRSLLSHTYMKLYKGLEKELISAQREGRAPLSAGVVASKIFEDLKGIKKKSFLRSLGVSSDFDILIDFGDIANDLKEQIIHKTTRFINSAENVLGLRYQTGPVKKAIVPFGDVMDYNKKFIIPDSRNTIIQGGSWLDWLAYDLETKKIRTPEKHPEILRHYLEGEIRYLDSEDGSKASDKQVIRALRPLLEIPFVSYDPESTARLRADLLRLKDLGRIDSDATEQVAKMQRNAVAGSAKGRFAKPLSGSSKDRALRQDIYELSQKVGGNIPIAAEFLDSKSVELRTEDRGQLKEQGFLVDPQTFMSEITANGVVYHGTPDVVNLINMLHNGCLMSKNGQGGSAFGSGFYTTKDTGTAKTYAKDTGLIIPLEIKYSDKIRILDRSDPKTGDFIKQIQVIYPGRDVNEILFTEFDVDIVLNSYAIVQNAAVLKLPKDPEALIQAQIQMTNNEVLQVLKMDMDYAKFERLAKTWLLHLDPNDGFTLMLKILGGTAPSDGIELIGNYLDQQMKKGSIHAADLVATRALSTKTDLAIELITKNIPSITPENVKAWYEVKRKFSLHSLGFNSFKSSFEVQTDPAKANHIAAYWLSGTDHVEALELLLKAGARKDFKNAEGEDMMYHAVRSGKLEVVKFLQTQGFDVNARDNEGNPVLTSVRDLPVMEYLVGQGADIQARNNHGESVIVKVSFRGSLKLVESLLEKGLKIDEKDQYGNSLLGLASCSLSLDLVKFLHQKGLPVDSKTEIGTTPALQAARNGRLEILKYLHEQGANLHHANDEGETCLEGAVKGNSGSIVSFLLEQGLDPNTVSSSGESMVVEALRNRASVSLEKLLDQKATIPACLKDGKPLDEVLLASFDPDVVKMLLDHGWATSEQNARLWINKLVEIRDIPLLIKMLQSNPSAFIGNRETLKAIVDEAFKYGGYYAGEFLAALVDAGADLSKQACGECYVSKAINSCATEKAILLLLKAGGDLQAKNQYNDDLMFYAVERGQMELVEYLLAHGFDISQNGNQLLTRAVSWGQISSIQDLIGRGVKPSLKDAILAMERGSADVFTLLSQHLPPIDVSSIEFKNAVAKAMENGSVPLLKLLKEQFSIDFDEKTADGSTYLHKAAQGGKLEVVRGLCEAGANLGIRDAYGLTAASVAARGRSLEVVQYFQGLGQDLNAPDEEGNTPLHGQSAISGASQKIISFLMENGADINVKNREGKTPLMKHGLWSIDELDFFLSKGADLNARDNDGSTVLHLAGDLKVIQHLIGKGFDIHAVNNEGETPLMRLVGDYLYMNKRALEPIKFYMHKGANINQKNNMGENALMTFVRKKPYSKYTDIKDLIPLGFDINAVDQSGCSILMRSLGKLESVKFFVELGANVDAADHEGNTVLMKACELGHSGHPVVEYLLQRGVNVNATNKAGQTAMSFARKTGWEPFILLLSDKMDHLSPKDKAAVLVAAISNKDQARIDRILSEDGNSRTKVLKKAFRLAIEEGKNRPILFLSEKMGRLGKGKKASVLCAAICCGEKARVEKMLGEDVNPNKPNAQGKRPLLVAAKVGNLELFKLLRSKGADVMAQESQGKSVAELMLDGWGKQVSELGYELLLEGCYPDLTGGAGANLLMHAISSQNNPFLDELFKRGVMLKEHDQYGSFVGVASSSNNIYALEKLIQQGADVNYVSPKDVNNMYPLDRAILQGHVEIVEFLLKNGAQILFKNGRVADAYKSLEAMRYLPGKEKADQIKALLDQYSQKK